MLSLLWYVYPGFSWSVESVIRNFVTFVVLDFLIVDCGISSAAYFCLNKWGLEWRSYRESRQSVEWRFCLDAFCNGNVAIISDFMVGYFLVHALEVAFDRNWVTTILLPNTVLFGAVGHCLYIFVESLNVLPFIKRLNAMHFLMPVIVGYVISVIFGWKPAITWISTHFV